jgi:ligand-binding sensor domain-containing protein/two-component sensor histidine kinase
MYIFLFTLLSSVCAAQATEEFQFNHFSADHGLSQTHFGPILQDKKGYMWFGTWNGLLKYDGYSFTTFLPDPKIKSSLPDTDIDNLCEDGDGNIWSSTESHPGLSKYNPPTGKFTLYPYDKDNNGSGPQGIVTSLITDKQGLLWIGTDAGVCFYDAASDKFIDLSKIIYPDTLCNQSIRCFMIDHRGLLWIGTTNGINIYDGFHKTVKLFAPADEIYAAMSKEVISLLDDHAGNIWISLWHQGIYKYNPSTGAAENYRYSDNDPHSLGSDEVTKLVEDRHQRIWAAMFGGISVYQPQTNNFKTFHPVANDIHSLATDQIINLVEDKSGVMWIGTSGGGLNNCYMTKKEFKVYQNYDKDFISHFPLSLYKDHAGRIFMATFGAGVQEFIPLSGTFKSYKVVLPNNTPTEANFPYGTLEASDGNFWVVSFNDGLHKLDRKSGKFTTIHSIRNNRDTAFHFPSNCIAEDLNKRLWIGTDNGLKYYDLKSKTFSRFEDLHRDTNQLSSDLIVSLYCGSEGILWIAGTNGVTLFNTKTGQVKIFKHDDKDPRSVSSNHINYFYDDGKGIVWIGTKGGGLNRFDKMSEQFVTYTKNDGLPDNSIYGITSDDRGNLWVSTNKGICKFTPPSSENNKPVCHNYNMSDGLPGDEHYHNSCVKGNDGTLYFASSAGLVVFKPDDLTDNDFIPPVVITDFSVLNKPVAPNDSTGILKLPADETKEIKLSYRQNVFSFTFSALSYVHPEKNQFAYMLEGFDKDWVYTDASKRFVTYTNLDPGDYTFKVKASNNDGVWNETPTAVRLIITPPYWKTWWFTLLCVLTGACIVFAIFYLRLQKLRDIHRIRNKIASDLHDDLGATLSSISIMSELANQQIKGQSPQASSLLEKIGSSSRNMIESVNDMVWAINPKNDSFENIIKRMRTFAAEILSAKDIAFHFDFDKNVLQSKLKMDIRRNFYLIFKEAVNNIAKYSYAANAFVMIWNRESNLKMTIRDDGNGFDPDSVLRGNGLTNMQQRAEGIKARFNLKSIPGKGTIVELEFKNA